MRRWEPTSEPPGRTTSLGRPDGYGPAAGDHPSSRTDPDEAERLTGIYDQKVVPAACSMRWSMGERHGHYRKVPRHHVLA